jgi:hypothetical protein
MNATSTYHALLWHGGPTGYDDLTPSGTGMNAIGTFGKGSQQAGYYGTGAARACFWGGSVGSIVDLHPAGATQSLCYGMSGGNARWFLGWNGRFLG